MYDDRIDRLDNKLNKLFYIIHDLNSRGYESLMKANYYFCNIMNNECLPDKVVLWNLEKSEKIVKGLYNKYPLAAQERYKVTPVTKTQLRKAKENYTSYVQRKLNKSEASKQLRLKMKGKR